MKIRRFVDNTQGGNIKVFNITDNSAPEEIKRKLRYEISDYNCVITFVRNRSCNVKKIIKIIPRSNARNTKSGKHICQQFTKD